MNPEIAFYRCVGLAIALSIATQVIQAITTVSPSIGGWFIGLASLTLIAVGVATFLSFRFSQWVLDGTVIAIGIAGGIWL